MKTLRFTTIATIASAAACLSLAAGCAPGADSTPVSIDAGPSSTGEESETDALAGQFSGDAGAENAVDTSDADFSCLDGVAWATADAESLEYTGRAVSAMSGEGLENVEFEVCADASDPSCSERVMAGTTEADGTFRATLPMRADRSGFDGYARVTGDEGVMNTVVFFNPPITENREAPESTPLVMQSTFDRLVDATMGVEPDPDRGHLALEALDCTWSRTAGVTFEVDAADGRTTAAYLRGEMMPSVTADRTDKSGLGGFLNVPTGPVTVTAKIAETGEVVGRADVFVEAGTVSEVAVAPTP